MAPYLLFGFLMAGLLSVWLSPAWVERNLGQRGFGPVLKAALLGVPLPLCSCGVIPVAASIRRHGASRAATTSFLLSTPQTGVDSIAVTYGMLGPVFAVFRPLVALLTGVLGGGLVRLLGEREENRPAHSSGSNDCTAPCCEERGSRGVVLRALQYGLLTLPRDIGAALLVGVAIAGAISTFTSPDQLKPYVGGGIVAILLMMAVGIPLYVCATASVPIAAAFIRLGASPGAALAFLIAGPATNAATITTVWKLLGRRTALLYLLTIAVAAVGGGMLLDGLLTVIPAALPTLGAHSHEHAAAAGWPSHLWAVLLLAVLAASYWLAPRAHGPDEDEDLARPQADRNGPAPQRVELRITGMTCSHCAASVGRALRECPGVESAEVELKGGRALVSGRQLREQQLVAAVEGLGYSATITTQ